MVRRSPEGTRVLSQLRRGAQCRIEVRIRPRGARLIHARAESITAKPAFRGTYYSGPMPSAVRA